jgi:hypothetical protein
MVRVGFGSVEHRTHRHKDDTVSLVYLIAKDTKAKEKNAIGIIGEN